MSQRRRINVDSERAYRVITVAASWQHVLGPYSTLGAAKGMVTREKRHWPDADVYIEQTREGWDRWEQ